MVEANKQVLVICLDAYDAAISDRLIAEGKLTGLAKIKAQSACFDLEHGEGGRDRYTGLTWEHFVSGLKPESAQKWSVISFDKDSYSVRQSHATAQPFVAKLDKKVVVFDAPYFDIEQTPNAKGVVGWGGHDTGMNLSSSPPELLQEIDTKFGARPNIDELNTMVYPDAKATAQLATKLCESVRRRTDICQWLLAEKYPEWDIGIVAFAEPHDAIELLVHGVNPDHHAAALPSAEPAKQGIEAVYEAVSDGIARLRQAFPDASLVTFTMHGMGDNDTDLPTMILLPELMYRLNFNKPFFRAKAQWYDAPPPSLAPGQSWQQAIVQNMQHSLADRALGFMKKMPGKLLPKDEPTNGTKAPPSYSPINILQKDREFGVGWMPSLRYRPFWSKMKAFAMPGYFDGRIRINLVGREQQGIVTLEEYPALVDELIGEIYKIRDLKTGEKVVKHVSCPGEGDPLTLAATQGDIKIIWEGSPIAFKHPSVGTVGPAPMRRMGGHSGGLGALYISGSTVSSGNYGVRSSYDVAPTVIALAGDAPLPEIDGQSVLDAR